jgi:hypothetical protein
MFTRPGLFLILATGTFANGFIGAFARSVRLVHDLVASVFFSSFSFTTKELSRNNAIRMAGTNTNNLFIFSEFKVKHVDWSIAEAAGPAINLIQ